MPITKDLELPIERVQISGPVVDALDSRRESDDGPSEEQVTKDARKNLSTAVKAVKRIVEEMSVNDGVNGISRRDYFAAHALQSLIAMIPNMKSLNPDYTLEQQISLQAYEFADNMIAISEVDING
jgi:hypothetical protein